MDAAASTLKMCSVSLNEAFKVWKYYFLVLTIFEDFHNSSKRVRVPIIWRNRQGTYKNAEERDDRSWWADKFQRSTATNASWEEQDSWMLRISRQLDDRNWYSKNNDGNFSPGLKYKIILHIYILSNWFEKPVALNIFYLSQENDVDCNAIHIVDGIFRLS